MKNLTTLKDDEIMTIVDQIPIQSFKKGTVLLMQGEEPTHCFFVLKGCVRQYTIDQEGNEITSDFFTEEQSVTIYNHHSEDKASKFSLACLEDSVLVVGDLSTENDMYDQHDQLAVMTRQMMSMAFGNTHETFTTIKSAAPEDRYLYILETRPYLIDRVPQHQLASYLGITPESLSRIKKRIKSTD